MAEEFTEKAQAEQKKRIAELLKSGASDEMIAELTGIKLETLRKYANGYQPASERILRMMETANELYLERQKKKAGLDALFDNGKGTYRRLVPVVSYARAGEVLDRDLSYHDLATQIDEMVETETRDEKAFGLIIEGDSMSPEYLPGDRVVFAPQELPRNGDVVVARLREKGTVYFKRFRRTGREGKIIRLESVNEAYDPLEFEEALFRFIYPAYDMRRRIRK